MPRTRPLSFLVAMCCSGALASTPAQVQGQASVIDGDTLDIQGVRIRLHAIDAVEHAQTCTDAQGKVYLCGSKAAFYLADLVKGKVVRCTRKDTDRYGRMVAVCQAGGMDLNRAMVRAGWAVAYTKYGQDYVQAELEARTLRAGLWAGSFQRPEAYRAAQRPASTATPAGVPVPGAQRSFTTVNPLPGGQCPQVAPIKGNITSKSRIYHRPGQGSYAVTKAEACFKTEADARAAGFRASGAH